jgi:hypothetical protein
MTFEEIKRAALNLPADERLDLAYTLLRSLEDEGYEIDWELAVDIKKRVKEGPGGAVVRSPVR